MLCSENYAANDVAGNFSLTLIDVLDTLVVLDDRPAFEQAVKNVIEWVSFDVSRPIDFVPGFDHRITF
jgi:mannosidase alpha-like ER degradation enhancer 1